MKKLTVQDIVIQFVEGIPEAYIKRISELLEKELQFDGQRILHRLQSAIPQEAVRDEIRIFVKNWESIKDTPSPHEMSLMVSIVATALKHQQDKQSIELIWTGPKSRYVSLRRTDQALIELINSAKQRVTIVSFAVYKAKNIIIALEKAAKRGAEINIIIESPESGEGKITFDTISAFGPGLRSTAKIFIWPYSRRLSTSDGKYGSLHAKIAVSDSQRMYISSANLTEYAMNLNMEMGIMISGTDLPGNTQNHFDELISVGILSELPTQ
jgi:phosphatidylserine/phosphatidylglycerophosphate/cardiolipin synthase-like enzyme